MPRTEHCSRDLQVLANEMHSPEIDALLRGLTTTLESADTRDLAHVCAPVVRLWEACSCRTKQAGHNSELPRRTLCLAAHLGPPVVDLTLQQAPVGRKLDEVCALLTGMRFVLHTEFPPHMQLHPATREALRGVLPPELPHAWGTVAADVYSDGSFDGRYSTWAVVVVGKVADKVVSVQWTAGSVCVGETCNAWLGAKKHGSLEAETTGLCWATMWAMSKKFNDDQSFKIDSMCAMMRAKGYWKFPHGDKIAHTSRCLVQAAEALGTFCADGIKHVKGHANDPWNELADCLAKAALDRSLQTTIQSDLASWVKDGTLCHLWLLIDIVKNPDMWPTHSSACLVDSARPIEFGDASAFDFLGDTVRQPADDSSNEQSWLPIRLASVA